MSAILRAGIRDRNDSTELAILTVILFQFEKRSLAGRHPCRAHLRSLGIPFGLGKLFEIAKVDHALLGECRLHKKAHAFHHQRRKAKFIFALPSCSILIYRYEAVLDHVEYPGCIVRPVEFFRQVVLGDRLDHFHGSLAKLEDQLGLGTRLSSFAAEMLEGKQSLLPFT